MPGVSKSWHRWCSGLSATSRAGGVLRASPASPSGGHAAPGGSSTLGTDGETEAPGKQLLRPRRGKGLGPEATCSPGGRSAPTAGVQSEERKSPETWAIEGQATKRHFPPVKLASEEGALSRPWPFLVKPLRPHGRA